MGRRNRNQCPLQLVVYTDGACINNGRGYQALGGYGLWFNTGLRVSGPLPGNYQTNQRAELYAILRALQITRDYYDPRSLVVFTDSTYAMNCVTEWLPNWRRYGFVTANNTPLKNKDLIVAIDSLMSESGYEIKFQHVRGHSGHVGNDEADRLAREGVYQEKEQACCS